MTQKQSNYFDLIARWQESGLTRKAFCAQHGVKLATFQYWVGKYRNTDADESFCKIGFVIKFENFAVSLVIYYKSITWCT